MTVPYVDPLLLTQRRDEIAPIPHPLGYSTEVPPDFDNLPGMDASFDIGGVLFLSAASDDNPYQRQLQKVTKQQIDTTENPGDNSLQDWWMRTQTDWSGGAGQEFMEPIRTEGVNTRYWASAGVDVFSHPGRVAALPVAVPVGDPLPSSRALPEFLARFATGFATAGGTEVRVYALGNPPVLSATQAASAPVMGLAVAAGFLMVSMQGKVATMPLDGSAAPTDRYTGAGTVVPVVAYMKNRTLVMAGDKVWEVPGNPDVALDMATANPVVNLHDASWSWVGAATTPVSILIAGNGAGTGSVLSLTVDPQSGNLPTLAAPTIVAELPPNEQITAISTYLGSYVVLATTAGIRVGELNSSGGLAYGPLLGSPISTGDFTMWDRFAQYPTADAGDGQGGLVRIDLSGLDKESRAPWSTFTRIPSDIPVVDHSIIEGVSTVMLDAGGQLWFTPLVGTLDTGWLETSKVRYGTLEGKNFQAVKVITLPPTAGSLAVSTLIEGTIGGLIGTMTKATGGEASFRTGNRRALPQMALRFDWLPAGDTAPVLEAWSMRSLPAITDRGQQILLPLLCFDFERTTRGQNGGFEGRAWKRWDALVARITNGADVVIKEIETGITYVAVAEDCSFTQVAPPTRASGFGGIINLLLREAR